MWLTEDPWPPMLICGLLAIVAVGWWAQSRRVVALLLAMGFLCVGAGLFFVEAAIVTEAEVVEQLTTDMCWQFQRKDPAVLDYFSPSVPQLRTLCQSALVAVKVGENLRLTDFQTKVTNDNSRATCHFRANASVSVAGTGEARSYPARFELTWAKEAGEWKVIQVRRLNVINGEDIGIFEK